MHRLSAERELLGLELPPCSQTLTHKHTRAHRDFPVPFLLRAQIERLKRVKRFFFSSPVWTPHWTWHAFLHYNGNITRFAKKQTKKKHQYIDTGIRIVSLWRRTKPLRDHLRLWVTVNKSTGVLHQENMTSHGKLRKEKGSLAEYETQIKGTCSNALSLSLD